MLRLVFSLSQTLKPTATCMEYLTLLLISDMQCFEGI